MSFMFTELGKVIGFCPRILRRQILEEIVLDGFLANELFSRTQEINFNDIATRAIHPSIRRFHGTLLFVDISGFTSLAQKLDVDNLRKFINAYFKKLIDIIDKYQGEVVKFAGDSMYIIWQTNLSAGGK
jgi:class 3 adenylate cyclase